jgi:hypothetical protein
MDRDRFLRLFLRVVGAVSGMAAFCAVMPYAWMNAIHQHLGMGALSNQPVVGYLARSTSAFYALFGGLFWVLSFDLPRYRPLVRYLGAGTIALGILLFAVDHMEGLPLFWRAAEGSIDVTIGTVVLLLSWRGDACEERPAPVARLEAKGL